MIKIYAFSISAMAIFISVPSAVEAKEFSYKTVGQTQIDSRPCFFFSLTDIPEADPVVPGQAWLAIPTTHANYQVMVSTIISSKLSNKPLTVRTDGTVSCGYATAKDVGFSY